jgi:hypothetical protein
LVYLFHRSPSAIAHPVVVRVVRRLRLLARSVEMDGEEWLEAEGSFPPGTREAAENHLRRLAEAIVTGIFQKPGWSLKPPPQAVGRPERSGADTFKAYAILSEYESLLECLQARRVEFRARSESHDAWMGRVATLITEAWNESEISRKDLPNDIARKSAEYAKATKKRSLALAKIATYLLAHQRNTAPSSIEDAVERAREDR